MNIMPYLWNKCYASSSYLKKNRNCNIYIQYYKYCIFLKLNYNSIVCNKMKYVSIEIACERAISMSYEQYGS